MKKFLLLEGRDKVEKFDIKGDPITKPKYFIDQKDLELEITHSELFDANNFIMESFFPFPSDSVYRNIEFAINYFNLSSEKNEILKNINNYEELKTKNLAKINRKVMLGLELCILNKLHFDKIKYFLFNYRKYSAFPYPLDEHLRSRMHAFFDRADSKIEFFLMIIPRLLKRHFNAYENDFSGYGFVYDDKIRITNKNNFLEIVSNQNNE